LQSGSDMHRNEAAWSRGLGALCWTHLRAHGHAHTWTIQEIWDCTQNRGVLSYSGSVQSHIDHLEPRTFLAGVYGSSVSTFLKVTLRSSHWSSFVLSVAFPYSLVSVVYCLGEEADKNLSNVTGTYNSCC